MKNHNNIEVHIILEGEAEVDSNVLAGFESVLRQYLLDKPHVKSSICTVPCGTNLKDQKRVQIVVSR